MKVMVMWCSLHMEQSLDDQAKDWQETFEFSQILWERSKVVFRIHQDRAAQNEQMEGIVDERVRAEITRPLRSIEDDNDVEVKRQRLGEPLATIPEMMEDPVPLSMRIGKRERLTKNFSREPVEMSSSSSGPKRMKLSCLRVSNVNAVQKPSTRTEESIARSRAEHIKHLLETGAVKDWNREDAIRTGAKILSGKMVDDAHKEKSRYCTREFATFKDPSVFAAASDVDNTSLIDLLAVKEESRYHVF